MTHALIATIAVLLTIIAILALRIRAYDKAINHWADEIAENNAQLEAWINSTASDSSANRHSSA